MVAVSIVPDIHRSYPRLREAVAEAWNAITEEEIRNLVRSMLEDAKL
jgi:hypothetical protein